MRAAAEEGRRRDGQHVPPVREVAAEGDVRAHLLRRRRADVAGGAGLPVQRVVLRRHHGQHARDLGHEKEAAAAPALAQLEAGAAQRRRERRGLARVLCLEVPVVVGVALVGLLGVLERDAERLLQRRGRVELHERQDAVHRLREVRRRDDPTHLPARHAEGLARAGHRHGAVPHAGEPREVHVGERPLLVPRQRRRVRVRDPLRVEADVLVDLVGDYVEVLAVRERRDGLELGTAHDHAGGVVRRVHDHDARARRHGRGERRLVELPARLVVEAHGHGHGHAAVRLDLPDVEVKVGLQHEHLVAGPEQRLEAEVQRLRGAHGHRDLV
mmetsp:Transcript_11425/g.34687  ORF Transcript_11425/g.34687 Transcript_11425/m.34687 type:complete len:328 (+) Transcript_11425:350-1333(+)